MAQNDGTDRQYTWQEVAKHNDARSAWVYIDDVVYDVTSFVDRHPGGRDMILLMAGRDITDLFTTYHPFTETPRKVIQQYRIGTLKGRSEFPSFQPDTGFYAECRHEIGRYFKENNLDYKSMRAGIWRYGLIMVAITCSWLMAWTQRASLPFVARLALMVLAGVFQGMLLIHTMHDCSHTAFGHVPQIWKYLGRICLDLTCGCSFDAWLHQHVVGHHVYTNIIEVDPDCPMDKFNDIRRLMPCQEWSSSYRLQWVYLPMVYCLYAFKNRIQDLTQTLFGRHNGAMRVNPEFYNWESYIRQVTCKAFWFLRTIVYPIFVLNNAVLSEFVPLFLAMELTTGYFLTFNFQVSHVSTSVDWPEPVEDAKTGKLSVDGEWARLQVETSVDYGHDSWLCTFWSGALNYQTVHHLFPSVSQYHYPQIAPIVMRVCKKYGVQFNHFNTFGEAFSMHIRQLYNMGLAPEEYEKMKVKDLKKDN